jgi:hypothetical protein
MRVWYYGVNVYHKTAQIMVDEAPWYIFLLDRVVGWICGVIPAIPLPKIKMKLNKEDADFVGYEFTTWKDWYGDTNQWFYIHIHMPVFHYCNSKGKDYAIPVDYDKLKELFYKADKEFWDNEIKSAEEIKEDDKK